MVENAPGSMISGNTPKTPTKTQLKKLSKSLYQFYPDKRTGKIPTVEDGVFNNPKRTIVRRFQDKSGSTTLLGGRLLGRAVIKGHKFEGFSKQTLEAWIRLYQHNWKSEGFNYNPIEPILKNKKGEYRIHRKKDGTHRVTVGIIPGVNLKKFLTIHANDKKIMEEVIKQRDRILEIKNRLEIQHRHTHNKNFVVTEEIIKGKRTIRVYLIDFDMATTWKRVPNWEKKMLKTSNEKAY